MKITENRYQMVPVLVCPDHWHAEKYTDKVLAADVH